MHKILFIQKNRTNLADTIEFGEIVIDCFGPGDKFDTKNYDLCIIEADFQDTKYFKNITTFIAQNVNLEFWAANAICEKNDIIKAYSIGCKNFLQLPLCENSLKKHFFKKTNIVENSNINLVSENFENMKILIIDDNEMNIELLKEMLKIFKLHTVAFTDPAQGLDCAKIERFDLILLDIMMPGINGFEFAEQIKYYDKNSQAPIVFISALNEQENKIKGFNLGSYAYIEKPFEINTVRAQLFNILKIRKLQKQKESFIATLTHDLKTPIRAQIRALELLLCGKFGSLNESQAEILNETLSSCKFLRHMTDDLLVKYRFDSGNLNIVKEKSNFQQTVNNSINSLKYLIEQKKQNIVFDYKSSVTDFFFDAIEISRVLHNLIINASEYSPEGGQIMIEVFENKEKGCMSVAVIDNGQGICKEDLKFIFDEYNTHAKKFRKVGAGLGLYIAKKIVQQHNGEIHVESEIGRGTKFVLSIPLEEALLSTEPTMLN